MNSNLSMWMYQIFCKFSPNGNFSITYDMGPFTCIVDSNIHEDDATIIANPILRYFRNN